MCHTESCGTEPNQPHPPSRSPHSVGLWIRIGCLCGGKGALYGRGAGPFWLRIFDPPTPTKAHTDIYFLQLCVCVCVFVSAYLVGTAPCATSTWGYTLTYLLSHPINKMCLQIQEHVYMGIYTYIFIYLCV